MNLVNPKTATAKAKTHREFLRLLTALENASAKQLAPLLLRQFKKAARALVTTSDTRKIDQAVDSVSPFLRKKILANVRRTSIIFGREVFANFKGTEPDYFKSPREEFFKEIKEWGSRYAAAEVSKISSTSKRIIRSIIWRGMTDGESNWTIAKNIRRAGGISDRTRAMMIARTETHTIATHSVDTAMATTGIQMEGEWHSTLDSRTRSSHLRAHGQRRAKGIPFDVGGEQLMFPGDASRGASAKNIIQCRCIKLYHVIQQRMRMFVGQKETVAYG